MYNRIPTILSVIFLGSMLLASSEGVTKKTINNDNVLSIENNVDLKQIESIGVSARNSIINKLDESLIVKQGGLNKKYKDINDLSVSGLMKFKLSPAQKNSFANKINESHNLENIQSENRDHCDAGYIDDCADDLKVSKLNDEDKRVYEPVSICNASYGQSYTLLLSEDGLEASIAE